MRRMADTVTLADVARHADVSLATASRVLAGASSGRTVGAVLHERVRQAALELGYTPNAHARAVARGATNLVGLVLHDIADPYFSAIAAGVIATAEEDDMPVMLASTRRSRERELAYIAMLRAQRAQAIVFAGSHWDDPDHLDALRREVQAFRATGGRVACVSQDRLDVDTVLPLNRAGARALARSLAALGHRCFAVLAGPARLLTADDRLKGFRAGLREAGVGERPIVERGEFTRDGGYAAARRLIEDHSEVTCLFAVNDVMAVGAVAALRDAGVDVPGDVSIAGFDDIETLRDLVPALSTVRLPLRAMGEEAMRMALDQEHERRVVRIAGEVVLRDSTAPPSGR